MAHSMRSVVISAALSALVLPLWHAPVRAEALDRANWECSNDVCTARERSPLGTVRGSFEYGANVSASGDPKRVAELRAQRYQVFLFNIENRIRIYADAHKDEKWVPADWPGDIGIQAGGPAIELWQSADGNAWEKIDNGRALATGTRLKLVVIQDFWSSGAYATFYPARWWVDLSYRLMRPDEGWGGDTPAMTAAQPAGDTAGAFTSTAPANDVPMPSVAPDEPPPGAMDCGGGVTECLPPPDPDSVSPVDSDGTAMAPAVPAAGAPANNTALDLAFWQAISASDDPTLYRAYLDRFPTGVFRPIAEARLAAPGGAATTKSSP